MRPLARGLLRLEADAGAESRETGYAQAQAAASVRAAVASLPPKFRIAVLLRYFDDLSYEEMAKALRCSMGTVASRLNRGHKMLARTPEGNDRMKIRDHLPSAEPPESVWNAIEAAIVADRLPARGNSRWALVFAAAAVVLAAATMAWWFGVHHAGWIQTSASAGATLRIGGIGTVDVGPNTRLRVVSDRRDQHRLDLAHGSIYARISAPPRLFFVDTKSGTAIDLGCEYALNMAEDGSGVLRVTKGWVSFQWAARESLVPAGAMCRIGPPGGPGLPYFEDAMPEFIRSVEEGQPDAMLRDARVRDTLTLWHLLSRVGPGDRGRVYDRIAALVPLPADISRERALALDSATLNRLKEELAWKW